MKNSENKTHDPLAALRSNGGLGMDSRTALTSLAHRIIAAGRTGRGVHMTAEETKMLLSNNLPCTADDPSVMDG